jgi:hypothetical protein
MQASCISHTEILISEQQIFAMQKIYLQTNHQPLITMPHLSIIIIISASQDFVGDFYKIPLRTFRIIPIESLPDLALDLLVKVINPIQNPLWDSTPHCAVEMGLIFILSLDIKCLYRACLSIIITKTA